MLGEVKLDNKNIDFYLNSGNIGKCWSGRVGKALKIKLGMDVNKNVKK
jgi:hypothetical protein